MRGLALLLAAAIVGAAALMGPLAHADSGITNDPDKLQMILLPRDMDVMVANPDPISGCTCHPPLRMGDTCRLAQGVGVRIRGTDRRYVLLEYPRWTEKPGNTCPRGVLFLATRAEFARRAPPMASRRLPAPRLLGIVTKILEKGRGWR